jgi:Putative beta-barrel porin 2
MRAIPRRGHAWRIAVGAALLCASLASPSAAQVGAFGGPAGPALTPPPVISDRSDPFARPSADGALPIGIWLLYPTVFAGAVYDSNVRQTDIDKVSSWGARLVPSLLAEATDGIHKTTLYGMADVRLYGDHDADNADATAARAGFIQRYQPMSDLVFNVQGDYTRQRDLFSTFGIDHSVTTLNPTSIGLAPVANPVAYNQFSAAASVQKSFDRMFISFAGSVVDINYDNHRDQFTPSPDGVTYTGTARGGFWFTPFLYAYAEGSVDQRRFSDDLFNSSGYRTVGGIGSDQIGLFRGEIYGGYQSEHHDFAPLGNVSGAVAGGRLYYYPTRELTISASVDESLGVSLLASVLPGFLGSTTRATTALLQVTYALAREWAASARFGYIHTDFVGTFREDDAWTAGATITYSVWRNFGLTLDYQHVQNNSNVPFQGFSRDVVTLGGTYKY